MLNDLVHAVYSIKHLLHFPCSSTTVYRKTSSFWPLADAKPMLNDLVHAVYYTMSLLDFHSSTTVYKKPSSFWPYAK